MPSLTSLMSSIPDGSKPLAAIVLGGLILVGLTMAHGVGLYFVLRRVHRSQQHLLVGRHSLLRAAPIFASAILLLLSLHVVEVMVWASTLIGFGLIPRPHDAFYFCANAYTTLGYGSVDLQTPWRNIGPIIAMSGLFAFAWTTSTLVDLVGSQRRMIAELEERRLQRIAARRNLK